ncbi:ClpA/ClpB-like protein [Mumia flava]|uniref:ClpA/ClpB-like protein n=1 Tax=Mumia flava TaxID=1348852 RepID=A0A2M9BGH3_9ACTN|nr:Clp protease N-terminal domain-containing protein [Mumia flava]PJJ57053.1 ClpA/ClpB-like protein [Mumia flava]
MTDLPPSFRLDDLIRAVRTTADDPLDQLHQATVAAGGLGEVADALVGYFVDQARRSGASWTRIGASMGVTKQAAQKRFVRREQEVEPLDASQGFDRFTEPARASLMAAHAEAQAVRSAEVEPVHLLLGLIADERTSAARALTTLGVTAADLRTTLAPTAVADETTGDTEAPTLVPYGAESAAALQEAFAHAVRLGDDLVGTGHVLLAVWGSRSLAALAPRPAEEGGALAPRPAEEGGALAPRPAEEGGALAPRPAEERLSLDDIERALVEVGGAADGLTVA